MSTQKNVSEQQLQTQFTYIDAVARLNGGKCPKAYTHTFGCQQNEAVPNAFAACCMKWDMK